MFNKVLRPTVPVEPGAAAVHRISDAEIGAAPSIADVLPVLRGLFDGRVVVSYNLDFDRRLLRQSLSAQGPRLASAVDLGGDRRPLCDEAVR